MTLMTRLVRPMVAAVLLAATTACANLFKLTPEEGDAPATTKPAVAKPAAPKPEAPKPVTPKPAATPKPAPPRRAPTTPAPVLPVAPLDTLPSPILPEPEPMASDSATVARLSRVAMLWQVVARFHPAVATRQAEWDAAVVRALPAIRAATSRDALTDALRIPLRALDDVFTRVETVHATGSDNAPSVRYATTDDGVAFLTIPPNASVGAESENAVARVVRDAPQTLVIDLRGTAPLPSTTVAVTSLDALLDRSGILRALVTGRIAPPQLRMRRIGESPTSTPLLLLSSPDQRSAGDSSNDVRGASIESRSGWIAMQPATLSPATRRTTADAPRGRMSTTRVGILANEHTTLSPSLVALVDAKRAIVVGDGVADVAIAPSVRIEIDDGVAVRVRVADALTDIGGTSTSYGTLLVRADTVVTGSGADADAALRAASAVARGTRPPRGTSVSPPRAPLSGRVADIMEEVPYPSIGARLLGAFRIWSVMRNDHVGRDAYDDDIDAAFVATIPRVEAARNRTEYAGALRAFVSHFDDSEARLDGASRESTIGDAAIPARVRFIEGRAIVTAVGEGASGIAVGTEINAIDGYPVVAWLADRRQLLPASNDWTRARDLARIFGRGTEGTASLRVRDATGPERTVSVPRRSTSLEFARATERSGAVTSTLANTLAYIDAERLGVAEIDSAFTRVASARGLVLDLRARDVPAAAELLDRLATRPSFTVARVVRRASSTPCLSETLRLGTQQCVDERITLPLSAVVDTTTRFRGRLVLLIDERTQGAAERLALALEAASGATFIGATSAGAAENTHTIPLPGVLTLSIATEEWRRSDGGPLHRVGITPLIEARTTVRGVRAGRDEVLDRAVQWLQEQLDSAPRRRR